MRVRLVGCVAHVRKMRNTYKMWFKRLKGRYSQWWQH